MLALFLHNHWIREEGIMKKLSYFFIPAFLLISLPQPAHSSWTVEEAAEALCDNYDGIDCDFSEYHGDTKFGSTHAVQGGNGKIRSESAYCLIRDGNEQTADATVGGDEDWYQFGVKSRFHVTYAGKDSNGLYHAEGQRLLDLVLFGESLASIEVQDLQSAFPTEKEKARGGSCKKWLQVGKKKMCSQYGTPSLSLRTGYYMNLDTHEYSWMVDVDEVARDLFRVEYPDLEVGLGQNVFFDYSGQTLLSGNELILNDGIVPLTAPMGNAWEWGIDPDYDPATTWVNAELPIVDFGIAEVTLEFNLDFHGYYALDEAPLGEGGDLVGGDPDQGQGNIGFPANADLATSTYLSGGMGIEVIAHACLDFGWFGEECADFEIVDVSEGEEREPMNEVVYTPQGAPLTARWANGDEADTATEVSGQIEACLAAPEIVQEPEEMADPADWVVFAGQVAEAFADHYEVCYIYTPPSPQVSYDEPSFKLCDDEGRVYEPVDD